MQQIIIDHRFRGPSQSANGGYIAGVLAELIDGPAEITLRRPPPLDRPLQLHEVDGGYDLKDGEDLIGDVRAGAFRVDVPPRPSDEAIRAAQEDYPGKKMNLLPHCFVCGIGREPGDGLRVHASPVTGAELVAAEWHAHPDLCDADGMMPERYVFAALDCPGAYAFFDESEGHMLLGRITGEVTGTVRAGDMCTVLAWKEGAEGRKAFAGSAVLNPAGEVVASAYAIWIKVPEVI